MRMCRYITLAACLAVLSSCTEGDERFRDAYTDVLVVRMTEEDSAAAQRKVMEALRRHGYTEQDFRKEFFERANQPYKLRALIDSARAHALQRALEMKSQQSKRQ
ncbi:MAG: hypothetical protein RMK00_03455 [Bacteroidota bacterium]|nr:hypothetical protein [Bacteroidota bacterium]